MSITLLSISPSPGNNLSVRCQAVFVSTELLKINNTITVPLQWSRMNSYSWSSS